MMSHTLLDGWARDTGAGRILVLLDALLEMDSGEGRGEKKEGGEGNGGCGGADEEGE